MAILVQYLLHPFEALDKEFVMSLKIKSILLSVALLFGVVGCNTLQGAGEDIEQGGEAIQRSAD
jgi:entericidin B